jgi:2,4-dienoyl-CoA reductase-like NADH-dependent reductase (Old Yellow Enzyme family)
MPDYPKIAQLKTVAAFRARLEELGIELPVDEAVLTAEQGSPLAQPMQIGPLQIGNRWCIHPMEGWDANRDGSPGELTLRRWRNFGRSGAKLIWGGEAAAVQPDGRANPNQTLATASNKAGLSALLHECVTAHREAFGTTDDFVVGLQLTHSGRFCRPNSKRLEPRIAYHHPLLDAKFGIDPADDSMVWTDGDLERLMDSFVAAAGVAREVGFQFVDIKACHGYLLHEFLSARTRPGRFGGDLDGRTRLLFAIIRRIREAFPDLHVLVRVSIFDTLPYKTSREVGRFGGQHQLRQPVLQPAHPAAGHLPAQRRLSAAGRPAGRRGPADSRRAGLQGGRARFAAGRHGLHVPSGLPAARRAGRNPGRLDRHRGPGADGPGLSRTAGRHTDPRHDRAQEDLPHVQRLHHRPPQPSPQRLLSARSVL